jgi:hypothetical protein
MDRSACASASVPITVRRFELMTCVMWAYRDSRRGRFSKTTSAWKVPNTAGSLPEGAGWRTQ